MPGDTKMRTAGGSRINLAAAAQAPSPEIRTPRLLSCLPTLPPLPPAKPGEDVLDGVKYIWVDNYESYRCNQLARLLYIPLFQTLKKICPEVDWTKLELWIGYYKSRRSKNDVASYLRKEDIEAFLDFMLKYHPVENLGDIAPVLDEEQLSMEMSEYFRRWDRLLESAPFKRQCAKMDIDKRSPANNDSGANSPLSRDASKAPYSPVAGRTYTDYGSSRATSADLPKKDRSGLEIPQDRRLLIGRLVKDNIERVTRAMISIYRTAHYVKADPPKLFRDNSTSEGEELVHIETPHPKSGIGSKSSSNQNLPESENTVNLLHREELLSRTSAIATPASLENDSSAKCGSKPLSPTEKHFSASNLAVQGGKLDEGVDYQSADGTIRLQPSVQFQQSGPSHQAHGQSEQWTSINTAVHHNSGLPHFPAHYDHIAQPKPVSPRTQAQLYTMHQYPHNHNFSHPRLLEPMSTRGFRVPPDAGIMNYLISHGTPISAETTPHIAMFTQHRREREKAEQEEAFRQHGYRQT
ncbi:hypothetical protein TWF694_009436 [Orbilia ellipsospora]|uniref:Uncharacterized protein n=1 Tax=Orbilia ellipsospora TaxID=2528407 RepID=A0AAV9XBN8_9PEZI